MLICLVQPESDENSMSSSKLFQMLTSPSVIRLRTKCATAMLLVHFIGMRVHVNTKKTKKYQNSQPTKNATNGNIHQLCDDTNLEQSHNADDTEELQNVVLLLEIGEYEVKVEGNGGDEVDEIDRLSHERQLVGADDEPDDQLERKPTVAHAFDEEKRLVRFRLPLVQHPLVLGQLGRRRAAACRCRGSRQRCDTEISRKLRQRQVLDHRQSKIGMSLEAEDQD